MHLLNKDLQKAQCLIGTGKYEEAEEILMEMMENLDASTENLRKCSSAAEREMHILSCQIYEFLGMIAEAFWELEEARSFFAKAE